MYTAKSEYLDPDVVRDYEITRFRGMLGRYRWRREQCGVGRILERTDSSSINRLLDCPVGNGRWLERLATLSPTEMVGVDVSPAMLEAASARAAECGLNVRLVEGVVESLPFDDGHFDLIFCHALAKHLPKQIQRSALLELSRVARRYVVCSFVVRKGIGGVISRVRGAGGAVVVAEVEIVRWAAEAGLRLLSSESSSTPVGLERSCLFVRS